MPTHGRRSDSWNTTRPRLTARRSEAAPLRIRSKVVFALGDHTVNLALSALGLVFFFFLTEVAGLRPALAGLLVWIARGVDAVTDPLMGAVSDATRWRSGRRRPYFLIGAIPFGVFFALLWNVPFDGQSAMFAYYLTIYIGLSLSMTVLSVPYLALIPEMATDYDERTSLNTFRAAGAVLGTLGAVGIQPLAEALGGGSTGFERAAAFFALWLILPWAAVYRVSFERRQVERPLPPQAQRNLIESLRSLIQHDSYRRLCALYISARVAVDITGLALIYFFTYWIGRSEDFWRALVWLMSVVILSFPVWLRIAKRMEKHQIFAIGAGWWMALLVLMFAIGPDWPRWSLFAVAALIGIGYAVADMMPWAMVGEVIDEDTLRTGERREGLYNGSFTFLRKLGGASAFVLAGFALESSGYVAGQAQTTDALLAIRVLATLVPALFLGLALSVALRYPLTRARHQQILSELHERNPQTGVPQS